MKLCLLLPACVLLLTALACQRELSEEELIYTGNWQSEDYALQIYQNGYGVCNSRRYGLTLHFEGRVKIDGNRMVFIDRDDQALLRKRFRIDQPPAAGPNGEIFMVLDGGRFLRL